MGKCVIEAPRRGSSSASAKVRHFGRITRDDEGYDYDGWTRLPSSRKQRSFARIGEKDFSDKLGPIHNYLINSCGRPWAHVYSEIAYNLGRMHSPGIAHIKTDHIDVATHTFRDGAGDVWAAGKYGVHRIGGYTFRGEFYIDPESGLLRHAPHVDRPYHNPVDHSVHPLSPTEEHRWINGIWYYQRFEKAVLRAVRGRTLTGTIRYEEETIVTVLYKRQLGKRDLKRYGLRNGGASTIPSPDRPVTRPWRL